MEQHTGHQLLKDVYTAEEVEAICRGAEQGEPSSMSVLGVLKWSGTQVGVAKDEVGAMAL
jgi:hypothetical protein